MLLKLKIPTGLLVRRRVFGVLWERVKVAVVQWSVHLIEKHRVLTKSLCCSVLHRDTEGNSPWVWKEALSFPVEGRPSWSPQTTWRTRMCCHDYSVISHRKHFIMHLYCLTCVSGCPSLHFSDFPASRKDCPWKHPPPHTHTHRL